MNDFLSIGNAESVSFSSVPRHEASCFRRILTDAVTRGGRRVSAFFAMPEKTKDTFVITAVLLNPAEHKFELACCETGLSYPSLTPDAPAFHWFEREIFEQYGIVPEGHPWLKPIRFHAAPDGTRPLPCDTDYFTMRGSAAHEVAVGPVHAGVIEPGHFRFQCMGEDVYSLEIELGYQHRGIENMLLGGLTPKTPHIIETASGDTSVCSSICHNMILESLSGMKVCAKGFVTRSIALELERIANHTGDLGALAGDVAFLPTSSYCGRIRGDFLNMTAVLCGNRFGRGLVVPGGVRYDLTRADIESLIAKMERACRELSGALELMFDAPSVLDRFENTGCVSSAQAASIGMVGVAARASNLAVDTRSDLPGALMTDTAFAPAVCLNGDVMSRASVRRMEIDESLKLVLSLLDSLPDGPCVSDGSVKQLAPDSICVSALEAWRGELCHVALTDDKGGFRRYKIVDPSFHNWFGLALALRGQQISDFPICNKSFNLSYCGHDL